MFTAKNPWFNPRNTGSKPEFTYERKPIHTFENGIQVFHPFDMCYDFVLHGVAVTQRAGFKPHFCPVTDDEFFWANACEEVKKHLNAHGFFKSAAQYPPGP